MNSLTVNLHLLMASFYRPTHDRYRIVIGKGAFCDERRREPGAALRVRPVRRGPAHRARRARTRSAEQDIGRPSGEGVAAVLLAELRGRPVVPCADHEGQSRRGHSSARHGAPLNRCALHEWGVDFAAWCSYKYLNGPAGRGRRAFVHEPWDAGYPRSRAGGATTRDAVPHGPRPPGLGAEAATQQPADLRHDAAARIAGHLRRVGMHALRAKSLRLHAYTRSLVEKLGEERFGGRLSIVTPREDASHGCQISIRAPRARETQKALLERGVVADFREPDIVRIAPVPLYNSFADCLRFVRTMGELA